MPPKNGVTKEYVEHLSPGNLVWLKVLDPDPDMSKKKTTKPPVAYLGMDGDLTFAGYQVIGGVTFLVVDQVVGGTGKKTQLQTFSINASHIVYAGSFDRERN